MALNETLRLIIEGDNRGAVKAVKGVGDATTREFGKSQKSIDKWGVGLTRAGVGMVALGAGALIGLGKMAKMSEEANLATVKLDNTLANMPKLAGENSKQFTDLATKIQGYSAADADAIIAGEAMLGTFNLTAKQIKGITPLVVDFSRKFGVDMVTASTMVGKALDGNVGALKRNGVSIDETAFKTDRYGAVQKALSDQVGGFAKAEGATFAGSLERMKNQLGDLAEGVGGGAVDAFTSMFGAVGKAAGALEKISPGAQHAAGQIATFASVGLIAAGGVSTLIGKLIEARQNFTTVAGGVKNLTASLGGAGAVAGFTAAAVGIGLVVGELERLGDESDRKTIDKITTQLEGLGGAFSQDLLDRIKQWAEVDPGGGMVSEQFAAILDKSVPAARQFVAALDQLDSRTKALIGNDNINKMRKAVEDKADADITGTAAQQKYSDEVQAGAEAMDTETEAANAAADAIKAKSDAELAAIDPLFAMQDALTGNLDAQADVNAKRLEAVAAEDAYRAAVAKFPPKSKEVTDAYFAMVAAQDAVVDADRDAVRSAADVERATADLRVEIKKNPAALDTAKQKLREWQAQGLITAAQAKKTAREFDGLAGSVKRIPGAKTIKVTARGTDGAKIKILQVHDALNRLHNKTLTIGVTTAIGAQAAGIMSSKMFAGQFAAGGVIPGRKGEPKIALVHGGEEVVPWHDPSAMKKYMKMEQAPRAMATAAAAHDRGNGGHVQVDVNIVGEGLMRYLRNQVRVEYGGDVQAALGSRR